MIIDIKNVYKRPNSTSYLIFNFIIHHSIKMILGLSLILLIYPSYQYFDYKIKIVKNNELINKYNNNFNTENKLLSQLTLKQKEKMQQDNNVTNINQQLKHIFEQNQVKNINIQWSFEQEKLINFSVTQNTKSILQLIQQINELSSIKFREITLTKLNQDYLIQLNAILVVNHYVSEEK